MNMATNAKRQRTEGRHESKRSAKRRAEEEEEQNQFINAGATSDGEGDDEVNHDDDDGEENERDERKDEENTKEAKKSRMKIHSNNTLFIRSLPYGATAEDLITHFSFVAPVKHAHIVLDPVTQKSRGFGFVTFAEDED